MCSNYQPVTRMDRMLTFFGVERDRDEVPHDVFPTGLAPFIRLAEPGSGNKIVQDGAFGLLPYFAKELAYGRRTYNARSETVAQLPSFRDAWRRGQRCIVPAEAIYEPNYESGKAVNWRIGQHGDVPMGIAGIYAKWKNPVDGAELFSFAMLTVNADDHPVMKRFHRPGEEKRMVVILDSADYDRWLACSVAEAPAFFRQWMGALLTEAAPRVRAPRAESGKVVTPPARIDPETGELF
jgi:putative SOS response-associated peptidase YedK